MSSDERPDFRSLLDHYEVSYKERNEQKILCPFHEERHPSCSVNLDDGLFRCPACGASGDAYNFVMLREDCDFKTAVSRVKEIVGENGLRVRGSNEPRDKGIFGGSRPERRNGRTLPYRPRIFRD